MHKIKEKHLLNNGDGSGYGSGYGYGSGSLLDDDSMTQLRTMAKEHDFQVWIEVVSSDDPVAVIIEEGEIKN